VSHSLPKTQESKYATWLRTGRAHRGPEGNCLPISETISVDFDFVSYPRFFQFSQLLLYLLISTPRDIHYELPKKVFFHIIVSFLPQPLYRGICFHFVNLHCLGANAVCPDIYFRNHVSKKDHKQPKYYSKCHKTKRKGEDMGVEFN
jgi:hypothetical protein